MRKFLKKATVLARVTMPVAAIEEKSIFETVDPLNLKGISRSLVPMILSKAVVQTNWLFCPAVIAMAPVTSVQLVPLRYLKWVPQVDTMRSVPEAKRGE